MMTYKNHALDDFLQHCVEGGFTEKMVRVGKSSVESSELQARNLQLGWISTLEGYSNLGHDYDECVVTRFLRRAW